MELPDVERGGMTVVGCWYVIGMHNPLSQYRMCKDPVIAYAECTRWVKCANDSFGVLVESIALLGSTYSCCMDILRITVHNIKYFNSTMYVVDSDSENVHTT
jgi:hypothetical protein